MNWTRIKKESECPLSGIALELENRDGSTYGVVLRDHMGSMLRVTATYGIDVFRVAPPTTEKKWRLSGTAIGLAVDELFDSVHEADRRRDALAAAISVGDDMTTLQINPVEVPVE